MKTFECSKNQYFKDYSGKHCATVLNVSLYDVTIPRDLHSGPGACSPTSQTLCGTPGPVAVSQT